MQVSIATRISPALAQWLDDYSKKQASPRRRSSPRGWSYTDRQTTRRRLNELDKNHRDKNLCTLCAKYDTCTAKPEPNYDCWIDKDE